MENKRVIQFRRTFKRMSENGRRGWCMNMVSEWGMPLDEDEKKRLYAALRMAMEWGVR